MIETISSTVWPYVSRTRVETLSKPSVPQPRQCTGHMDFIFIPGMVLRAESLLADIYGCLETSRARSEESWYGDLRLGGSIQDQSILDDQL